MLRFAHVLICLCVAGIFVPSIASRSSAKTKAWHMVFVRGDTLTECRLSAFNDTLLSFERNGVLASVAVDSLDKLFRRGEPTFWKSAGYGAVGGAAIGLLVGLLTGEKESWSGRSAPGLAGAAIGAAGGFVIGGIIGALIGGDEAYSFAGRPRQAKIMLLRQIMDEEKLE